jgi:hypothetical protein
MSMLMAEPVQAPLAARIGYRPHGLPNATVTSRPAACVALQRHRCLTGAHTV